MKQTIALKRYIHGNEPMLFRCITEERFYYSSFQIPKKKKGEFRTIEAPNEELKKIQGALRHLLTSLYQEMADYDYVASTGTEKKTNIATNAEFHTRRKHILNIDISDFFGSVKLKSVNQFFLKELELTEKERIILLNLTTTNHHLPQGAPSSPILSNLICIKMDKELEAFAFKNKMRYSRYIDDMTFSSNDYIESTLFKEIEQIINNYQFQLNKHKTRFTSHVHQQTVTGLVVNKRVNINNKKYKQIRAIVYDMCNRGLVAAFLKHNGEIHNNQAELIQFLQKIQGYVHFLGQVLGKGNMRYIRLTPILSYNNKRNLGAHDCFK